MFKKRQPMEKHCVHAAPAQFFHAAYQAYQRAEQAMATVHSYWYEIAGFPIRLQFAGAAMAARLTPALEHLAVAPTPQTPPALTVCLWDTVSTGVAMPTPPWEHADYQTRAEVRGFSNARFQTAYDVWGGALRMLDHENNVALFWTRDAATLPTYDRGAPLRMILHWWMRARGRQFVHAGAVGTPDGGVLLAGKSGSGKSTTTLTCLNAGLGYAGDDYCLVTTEPKPYVYSLYNSAKLDPANLQRHAPHLEPLVSNWEELETEKALLYLHHHYPEKLSGGFPLRAILLPRVTGETQTTLTCATPIAALQALAPSTLLQLSGAGAAEFQRMSNFVKQIPSYHLALGTDLAQIPQVILRLLKEDR
jgi:hypothetical protein